MSAQDHMRAAFAALLKGDLAERDRQCTLAETALEAEKVDRLAALMAVDFFVTPAGIAIPITKMMPRA